MGAGSVSLPEGFTLDPPKLPPKTPGNPDPASFAFTPQEQAMSDQAEANPALDTELAKEIERNKNNPKALAVLQQEQQKRAGAGGFQNVALSTGLPEGFQLDQPKAQQKKATTADFLYGDLPISAKPIDYNKNVGTAEYILNEAKVGAVAGVGGFLGDVLSMIPRETKATDLINPIGIAMTIAKKSQDAWSTPGEPKAGTSAYFAKKLLGYDPEMKAPDPATRFAGGVTQFVTGGIGSPIRTAIKEGPKAATVALRELGIIAPVAEGAAELGEKATDSPLGGFIGSLMSVPAFAYLRKLPATARFVKGAVSEEGRAAMSKGGEDFLQPIVQRQAESTLARGLQEGGDKAVANLEQAGKLQQTINRDLKDTGQQVTMSAGQASGAPRIVNAELEARKSSYSANAAATAQTEKNSAAVLSYIQRPDHPLTTTIKAAVDKGNAEFNAQRNSLVAEEKTINQRAQALPDTIPVQKTHEERGQRIRAIAQSEKSQADVVKNRMYGAVEAEANRVGAEFEPSMIDSTAKQIMQNPLLRYDSTNAPSVIYRIEEIRKRESKTPESSIILPEGVERPSIPPSKIKFKDIQAMLEAVNQDIFAERAAAGPNTRQRLRALVEMKSAINGAVVESPYPELRKLMGAATDYYRDTYSPRFNTGVNAKLWMKDNYGENKILDERVLGEYSKNVTNVGRFVNLFGKNPEALAVMQDHIFDKFKKFALKDGAIDPVKYQKFLKDNSDVLRMLQKAGLPTVGRMNNIRDMTQRWADRSAELVKNEKAIAESDLYKALQTKDIDKIAGTALSSPPAMGRLTRSLGEEGSKALASKVMRDFQEKITFPPESGKVGLNTQAMTQFLTTNDKSLRIMFRAAYGPKEGAEHLDRLKTAYQMMAIQDRVKLPANVNDPSGIGKDPLKAATNISIASLFSMFRAVARGVSSPQNVAIVLGGQAGSGYLNRAYNNLMQSIATDPESSKYLLDLARTGAKPNPTKADMFSHAKAMAGILSKLGYFWVGGKYYGPTIEMIAPGAAQKYEEETRQSKPQ